MKKSNHNSHFSVPENYFERQEKQWQTKWGSSFKVPPNYFENQRIFLGEKSKTISIRKPYTLYYKVAALFIVGLLITVLVVQNRAKWAPIDADTQQVLSTLYIESSSEEIPEDMDLLESYFGEITLDDEIEEEESQKTIANYTVQPKTNERKPVASDPSVDSEDELESADILYDIYLNEETPSEEEVPSYDDYIL